MSQESPSKPVCRWFCAIAKWFVVSCVVMVLLVLGAFGFVTRHAIYHRFVLFPKQAQAWKDFERQRQPVPLDMGWPEFRGIMHNHSEISHDSEVPFPDILAALKKDKLDFIFMTDHPPEGKADYSLGWKGTHDGVLFVRGFEMQEGFMPWGLPDDTVLSMKDNPALMAKRIKELGGISFYAHSEEPRQWELEDVSGMEIYNIHTNLKTLDRQRLVWEMVPDFLWSFWSYPDQAFRSIYLKPVDILARWDAQNRKRTFTGIAATDIHQNTGIRGVYSDKDTLKLMDTGHAGRVIEAGKTPLEFKLNVVTRALLRMWCGPLEPNRQLFRKDFDPYERSARFVNTHIFARECTEPALIDALRNARVFVGFDMLADAHGFAFLAEDGAQKAVIGERIPFSPNVHLRAGSPVPCRFCLIHDGTPVGAPIEGRTCDVVAKEPGKYRIEAELQIVGEWTPWVFTNPIEVKAP